MSILPKILTSALLTIGLSLGAVAAEFPTKTLTIVVPNAPENFDAFVHNETSRWANVLSPPPSLLTNPQSSAKPA